MRVIGGKAGSIPLITPAGRNTRPTTDRIKETLFNMLAPCINGCSFLDLFSGSGAIGIEALSRGAASAVFVDSGREAIRCIKANLEKTHLTGQALVLRADAAGALQQLGRSGRKFDVIFMDPPYGRLLEKEALQAVCESECAPDHVLIVIESDLTTDFSYLGSWGFTIEKIKKYKTNQHVFVRKNLE